MNAISDQQLTVDDTAGGVSLTLPAGANRCFMEVETATLYYTLDAATPSSTNGGQAGPKDTIPIMGNGRENMRSIMGRFRALRKGATSALLNIHYFD